MTLLVHLTSETNSASIKRAGIRMPDRRANLRGIFAFPVLPNFVVSHQWLRELKRRGKRTYCGVYFRVPDTERVLFGHYRSPLVELPAARAAGLILKDPNPLGYQVVVPRAIRGAEILRIRRLPQVLGWRYFPGAHGRKPCGCPACIARGEIKSRKIRERFNAENGDV